MPAENNTTKISKFLSLVLRHKPETIGIVPDESGWVSVAELLEKTNAHGLPLNRETLQEVVETNAKKRFAFSPDLNKIRASQGHSIGIALGYAPQHPPEILYHGTAAKNRESILQTGIENRGRDHVHLSSDIETAIAVGKRHGKPIVFEVFAAKMAAQNHVFYLSENGVWLTGFVPGEFLREMQAQ